MRAFFLTLLTATTAFAEVHTLTLRQALDRALQQNPDVLLSRLDEQKARDQVTIARDASSLKAGVGSGAAYTYGFPASINGNAPSIFRAQTSMAIFDRPMSYRAAQASESARGSALDITMRQEEVTYRVYTAFLDIDMVVSSADAIRQQIKNLGSVKNYHEVRAAEKVEKALPSLQAASDIRRAEQEIRRLTAMQNNAEIALAQLLGLPAGDQVHPANDARGPIAVPESADASIQQAIAESLEIRRLQSGIQAKLLESKSYQAEKLPKINLIGDYQRLTRFNNYDKFYPRYQANNFQIGASIEIPILVGRAPKALESQAQADIDKMRIEIGRARGRITADVKQAYSDLETAEGARQIAREDLDLARAQTADDLLDFEEGGVPMARVEASRAVEQQRWVAYYSADRDVKTARVNILRSNGTLLAALR